MTRLNELAGRGQAIWLDYIRRAFLVSGDLENLIDQGLRGVTSNPSIFEKAIAGSADYDEDLGSLVKGGGGALLREKIVAQATYLESLGAEVTARKTDVRGNGPLFRTDHDNIVLDCRFGPIHEPAQLAVRIRERSGIVEHGLFLGLATEIIIAGRERIVQWKRDMPNPLRC